MGVVLKQKSGLSGKIGNLFVGSIALVAALSANTSLAAIYASTSGPAITGVTNTEDFESYSGSPGEPLVTSSGLTFDCGNCSFHISFYGGSNTLYQNGGSTSMTSIMLTSGADISAISMVNFNGFGNQDPSNIWVRAYNNGSPVASFPLPDTPLASTITVWADGGSVFDEVRIQAYNTPGTIDEDEAQYGAIAIDDVIVGQAPPSGAARSIPTLSFWGIGILAGVLSLIGMRRRIK